MARFAKPFKGTIEVGESEDYPGFSSVCVRDEETYSEIYRWTGTELAEGVAAAISCMSAVRDVHNAQHAVVRDALAREQNAREEFGKDTDPVTQDHAEFASAPLKTVAEAPL